MICLNNCRWVSYVLTETFLNATADYSTCQKISNHDALENVVLGNYCDRCSCTT